MSSSYSGESSKQDAEVGGEAGQSARRGRPVLLGFWRQMGCGAWAGKWYWYKKEHTRALSLSLSLSLSLTHTHTHTHTHTQGGNRKQNPGKCDEKELSSDRSLIRECWDAGKPDTHILGDHRGWPQNEGPSGKEREITGEGKGCVKTGKWLIREMAPGLRASAQY